MTIKFSDSRMTRADAFDKSPPGRTPGDSAYFAE